MEKLVRQNIRLIDGTVDYLYTTSLRPGTLPTCSGLLPGVGLTPSPSNSQTGHLGVLGLGNRFVNG